MRQTTAGRWIELLLTVLGTAGGTYLTGLTQNAHGVLLWLPTVIAGAGVLKAGITASPAQTSAPVPVSGPAGGNDPVNVEVRKP